MLAAAAVGAGAFGAHALRQSATSADLNIWRTAAVYLLVHGIAVACLGASKRSELKWPILLLAAGSTVFSASLFSLVLTDTRALGAVAPVGGALMIIGWLFAAVVLMRGTIHGQ